MRTTNFLEEHGASTRSFIKAAALLLAVVGAAVLLVTSDHAPSFWRFQLSRQDEVQLNNAYCSRLPAGEQQLCQAYVNSGGEEKGFAAISWRRLGSTSCKFAAHIMQSHTQNPCLMAVSAGPRVTPRAAGSS
jgi:hypothetical protein